MTIVRLTKYKYQTLILSVNLPYLFNDMAYDTQELRSDTLKCLKLVDMGKLNSFIETVDYNVLLNFIRYSKLTYFDVISDRQGKNYDKITKWLDNNRLNSVEYFHKEILEIYLIFVEYLPPYVALEIFDWLPLFIKFSHVYKINLIQSIYDSYKICKKR